MKEYIVSDSDIVAINRFIELGGRMATVARDSVSFEVGILSESGYMPKAYGSGNTIADAINEAIGPPPSSMHHTQSPPILSSQVEQAITWLRKNNVISVIRN